MFWLPSRTITHTSVVTGVFNDKNRKPHFFGFKRYLFSLLVFKALPVDINLWHIKFKLFKIKGINFWYLNFKLQKQGSFFLTHPRYQNVSLKIIVIILCWGVLHEYVPAQHMCAWCLLSSEEGVRLSETEVTDGCQLLCECGTQTRHSGRTASTSDGHRFCFPNDLVESKLFTFED